MNTRRKSFAIATGAMAAATVIGAGPAGAQEAPAAPAPEQAEQAPVDGALEDAAPEAQQDTPADDTTGEAAPAEGDAEAPGAECGLDAEAIAEETPAPEDFEGDFPGWTVENVASSCGNLGAVELSTEGATGSSPTKVVLVNAGTPTKTQPEGNTTLGQQFFDFAAVVNEKQAPEGDDPNAEAPQTQSIYVWNPLAGDVVGAPIPAGSSI
ncbi:hypothetical protein [Dietzia timorensis]|uniref:Secreted protein n=2 Tax=Dietzia timorensis TaxID=499555 RepID=A0A173LNN6_9ACTN|nr:hypothetical protein [Dietzia timorensis]ANI93886.1 Hypothetical protein BJL86_3127 [Dietzia timorensis]